MTSVSKTSIIHNTFVIERSYPQSPDQVFAAFSDPTKKRRWYAESDSHDTELYEQDFRVGGHERFQYRFKENHRFPGVTLSNEGTYQDIVPNERLIVASHMRMGGRPISVSLVSFELLPNGKGTDLICTHQGVFFEGSDGPQMREGGWRKLFDKLDADLQRR